MNPELRDNLWRASWRLLFALPLFGLGYYLLCGGLGAAFYGAALIIVGACIAAFPLAELFGRPLMSLFWPTASGPVKPNYSIPEAHVKQGRYDLAMAEYAAIARQYPDEVPAYIGMIEVAFRDLHDPGRAATIYQQGMDNLQNRESKAALRKMYEAFESLHENPPH